MITHVILFLAIAFSGYAVFDYVKIISMAITRKEKTSLNFPYFLLLLASICWTWFYYLTHN